MNTAEMDFKDYIYKPKKKKNKGGRRKGSKNLPVVEVELPNCPRCGSTNRSEYSNHTSVRFYGQDRHGRPFNSVVYKTCTCLRCGQKRRDRFNELT